MSGFTTRVLPATADVLAPDGSEVRILASVAKGSMAHFHLASGQVSRAVCHRSVEELWFVTDGAGEIWRKDGTHEEVTRLVPGLSLSIPRGTQFQFRADAGQPLSIVGVTMPEQQRPPGE